MPVTSRGGGSAVDAAEPRRQPPNTQPGGKASAFCQILQSKRHSISPTSVGLPARGPSPGPRVTGLRQEDVAGLTNRSVATYARIESGASKPTPEYLRTLALLLRFKESEYVLASLELFGTEPAPLDPRAGLCVPSVWERAVDGQTEMAYVNDRCFNLAYWNRAFVSMFPSGHTPKNIMEWMCLSDEARDGVLLQWETQWAPRVFPQFHAALVAHPNDPVLASLRTRILADRRARRFFDYGDNTYIHPDGDRRPFLHPQRGTGWVTIVAAGPLSSPGARYTTLLFDES
ncbi:helix-turn-helix domain-containing protein [Streptomyces sp. NPDC015350]|uniref:helix-turn-helix domain-containing protein n=1 Tax=Streptomyces sp. NPDC015350 TaxID=3364955 RepID=UPI0036F72C8C